MDRFAYDIRVCGRYRLKDPKRAFDWLEIEPSFDFKPRFNIAPTQRIRVVTAIDRVREMAWGLAPAWAGEKSRVLVNARSETIRDKRTFGPAFRERRCLLPADGFYEWAKVGKRPYLFTLGGDAPFAIAGIWGTAEDRPRCCLLTTTANRVVDAFHHRMPVIVRREDWAEWFSPVDLAEESFLRIMAPYPPGEMSALGVSARVNSARVDDPECCEPWAAPPAGEPVKPDGQQTFGF